MKVEKLFRGENTREEGEGKAKGQVAKQQVDVH